MKALRFPAGLYGVTPEWDDTERLMRAVRQAAEGGMRALQLRRKDVPDAVRAEQARALAPLCRELGVVFLINDDWRLALEVDADGAHVGRDDDSLARIRAEAGPDLILGGSSYDDLGRARELLDAGADYIAFGAMFPSRVKPDTVRAPLSVLTERPRAGRGTRCAAPRRGRHRRHHARERGAGGRRRRRFGRRHHRPVRGARDPRRRRGLRRALLHQPQPEALTAMSRNAQLFERASRSIPGGVNSPVRAFRSVGGTPRFIKRAQGPYVWDAEDKQYIDYVGSWGPAILGHSHPEVVRAVQEAAVNGLSFGAPTEAEIELAEVLIARLPSLEQVRLVSSGTEATMTAIRLARGATGRNKIVKFEGCYHGHSDSLLVKAGSGLLTFGNPSSAGVPPEFVSHTLTLEYNNLDAVREAFAQHGADIACIIVEPIAGNMNLIKPAAGFLEGLREVCTQHGALLIFDEVMTGFRVGPQGVQGLSGVKPDLTTLAKVIGGGMPVGAFGGSAEIMKHIAPLGGVYQAGTLSGNPVAVAAGLATLRLIAAPGFYDKLAAQTAKLAQGLQERARAAGLPFSADSVGGMFGLYFSDKVPATFAEVSACDTARFNRFFHAMLDHGVHFAPSAFEAGFVSATHDDAVIQATLDIAEKVFATI